MDRPAPSKACIYVSLDVPGDSLNYLARFSYNAEIHWRNILQCFTNNSRVYALVDYIFQIYLCGLFYVCMHARTFRFTLPIKRERDCNTVQRE